MNRRAHDSASPEGFAEPVAEFGGTALNIGPELYGDGAGGLAIDLDAGDAFVAGMLGVVEEGKRVTRRIRMREAVAQISSDVRVVGVARDHGRIVSVKGAQAATSAVELTIDVHASSSYPSQNRRGGREEATPTPQDEGGMSRLGVSWLRSSRDDSASDGEQIPRPVAAGA